MQVFKECVNQIEEALAVQATEGGGANNEWLQETNALKTEQVKLPVVQNRV